MMSHVLRLFGLTLSALALGGMAGYVGFAGILYLPALLGQPSDTMAAWAWITFLPAVLCGLVATVATPTYLFRRFDKWGLLAQSDKRLTDVQRVIVVAFSTVPVIVAAVAANSGTREYVTDVATGYLHDRWSEEVSLDDNAFITVKRLIRLPRFGGPIREASISFLGEEATLPEWNHPFSPLVLYKDTLNGEWTIVAKSNFCSTFDELWRPRVLFHPDRPPTSYLEYRARRGRWVPVPLSRASVGRQTNLLTWYEENHDFRVSARDKIDYWAASPRRPGNPFHSIVEIDAVARNCGGTTDAAPIWAIEDEILAALDRHGASSQERQRVEELLAGTRRLNRRNVPRSGWIQDDDPSTVEYVGNGHYNGGKTGVSADGEVIYWSGIGGSGDAWSPLFRQSYARRMNAAGLGKFAPSEESAAVP